jgi:predicted nucleic acid-binding protein
MIALPLRTPAERTFKLMKLYADHPMDLADASLVAAAEALGTRRVFTIDRREFAPRWHAFGLRRSLVRDA